MKEKTTEKTQETKGITKNVQENKVPEGVKTPILDVNTFDCAYTC